MFHVEHIQVFDEQTFEQQGQNAVAQHHQRPERHQGHQNGTRGCREAPGANELQLLSDSCAKLSGVVG